MRVWVARAEPAASRTVARLRESGHAPLVAPIFAVVPSGEPAPLGPFEASLLTSANAAGPLARAGIAAGPVFAVGRRTAEAARAAGLASVLSAEGDASALAILVRERLTPGTHLLHAAGEDRKAEPAATLLRAGYRVTPWIAYAARPVDALPQEVASALMDSDAALGAALHYSRRSAATALALARAAGLEARFRALRHLCLSADVAVPLVEAGIAAHFVPARPDEASLLAGLAQSS